MASDAFILQGTIDVDVTDAVSSLNKVDSTVDSSGKTIEGMGSKISKFGKMFAGVFAAKEIANFGVECLGAASNVEEMENKFNVVFKSTSESMESWSKAYADSIGRSNTEIKTAISNQADLMIGMGMSEDTAGDLSKKYTELAYDLASFNNVNDSTAIEAMTKAMFGETEMAKQLGLNLSATTMQNSEYVKSLGKSWDSLSQSEKAEAYYQEALAQSVNAVGDAERSSNSYANQIRRTQAKITEFTETLGAYFLPMATKVVTFFGKMVDGAIDFVNGIAEKWTTIGVPIIDNIKNNFSEMGITTQSIMEVVKTVFQGAWEFIKTYWSSIGQPIFDLIVQVIGWVKDAFAQHMPQITAFFSGFVSDVSNLWNNNLKPCYEAIGNFISNVLAPVFEYVFNTSIVPTIERAFHFIAGLWNNSLKPVFTGIIDFITGVFSGNWSKAWQGIVDMLGGIFGGIVEIVKVPINAVIGIINRAISGLNSISVNIPDWVPGVGGKTFGVNIPEMSYLENGGILTEPTLIGYGVMAGEKNKGRSRQAEAVIPLDTLWNEISNFGNNIAAGSYTKSIPVLEKILKAIEDKDIGNNTYIEFKDNNFDARETKQTLSQIRFAANF